MVIREPAGRRAHHREALLRAAENFGVSRATLSCQIVLPGGAAAQILVGMRIGLGVAGSLWWPEMIALTPGLAMSSYGFAHAEIATTWSSPA